MGNAVRFAFQISLLQIQASSGTRKRGASLASQRATARCFELSRPNGGQNPSEEPTLPLFFSPNNREAVLTHCILESSLSRDRFLAHDTGKALGFSHTWRLNSDNLNRPHSNHRSDPSWKENASPNASQPPA